MKHPTLKIEKTENAEVTWAGLSAPRLGSWSYRVPATYRVTAPTGRIYTVTGTGASFMQRPYWQYECKYAPFKTRGGFGTMSKCLDAIVQQEQALAAPKPQVFKGASNRGEQLYLCREGHSNELSEETTRQ